MKHLLAALLLLSTACGGATQAPGAANPNNEIPRPAKTPVKFGALPPLPDEGPLAERPTRMLKALQAKGYAAVLQKDKSVLVTTEMFGVLVQTNTAHLCQFDLPFRSGKGGTDLDLFAARITNKTTLPLGTNFTILSESSMLRVTARYAFVVENETECAELASIVILNLGGIVDMFVDVSDRPVFLGGSNHEDRRADVTTIQLSGINTYVRAYLVGNTQGYRDYYYAMLDSEGAAPKVDAEGDLSFSHEGARLYIVVPKQIYFPDVFTVEFQSSEPAADISLPIVQAACIDAMTRNVFIRCTCTPNGDRVTIRITSLALLNGSNDPRHNFRNLANAVHQASVRFKEYYTSHK